MANDRVMLKCKGCGERYCLLRYYPQHERPVAFVFDDLGPWLDKHCETCHAGIVTQDLEGDPRFTTECE